MCHHEYFLIMGLWVYDSLFLVEIQRPPLSGVSYLVAGNAGLGERVLEKGRRWGTY